VSRETKAEHVTACVDCGGSLPPYSGKGPPRKRCKPCAADKAALGKAWRAENQAAVDAYNAARRHSWASRKAELATDRLKRVGHVEESLADREPASPASHRSLPDEDEA